MPDRKYTDSKRESNRKWDANNLDRISLALKKGKRDQIKEHAASMGESMNQFVTRAIDETIERDKEKQG